MQNALPLPRDLAERYQDWHTGDFVKKSALFRQLAAEGQQPKAMIVACCDSRVQVSSIFGADPGDFFIHRNIANFVPPYQPDGDRHGTSAAIEYGVTALKVSHLIVMGHSQCGGVAGCHAMCSGNAPELEEKTSFVGRWIDGIRPAFDRLSGVGDEKDQLRALEMEAVLVSLENLMTFPFIRDAVENGDLSIHGLWTDIGPGGLMQYDADSGSFQPV